MSPDFHDDDSLDITRKKVFDALGSGCAFICPCCGQHVQCYRRKLNSGQARSLIWMWKAGGTEYIHLPTTIPLRSREEGKLRYWGLVEELQEKRPDGGRAGWWRLTRLGEEFVRRQVSVASHIWTYADRCLGLDRTSTITIIEALGKQFNYDELMAGE